MKPNLRRAVSLFPTLFVAVACGCGKSDVASTPSPQPEVATAATDAGPKAKTQAEPTPAKPPAAITWQQNILNNAPGYLMPYQDAGRDKIEPEKAWDKVRTELAKDTAAKALLKKLMRVETLEIAVVEGRAPDKFSPTRQPQSEDDGLWRLYLQPATRATIKGHVLLDFRYSVISARSSTLTPPLIDASDFDATRLAVNDFLLRNRLGYYFGSGESDDWDETQMKSADELRKQLNVEIDRHVKKNSDLPLKLRR